jgi:hypothetical protein
MKEYKLYLTENCTDCDKLLEMRTLPWEKVEKVWEDRSSNNQENPIIFPALKKGNKLLAYGYDQISVILS